MVYTAGLCARERREATIPRTRNARTRAYISTVSHSLSSGKFIRANIRDAVKVTLFNVHPLRETSVHTPCAARRRPTRPLSTSFQTTTRFFNSLEKRPRATAFSPLFLPPLSRFAPICAEQPTLLTETEVSSRNRREKTRIERDRKKLRWKKEGETRGSSRKLVGVILETGFFDELFQGRNALPTQHPITVRINAIIRSARKGLRGHGMRVNVVINKSRSS